MAMSTQAAKSRMPGAQRRELIVEAALAEFAELGYEAASMGRVAAAAGVSRTVLYDHFSSKLELFKVLLHTEQQELISYLSAAFDSPGTTKDRWLAAFDAFFRFVEEQPLGWRLLYPRRPPLEDDAAHEYRRQRDESNRVLADLLAADARRAGLEPQTVRARALFAMHSNALIAAARWWASHPEVAREEIVGAAMAALWTGFGGLQPPES
jgi:AcrR family transcriptional regulator